MDYRIIAANSELGQIRVTYSDNGIDIATYDIDVPIIDGKYITGIDLENEIQARAPIWLLNRKNEAITAQGFDSISALVHTTGTSSVETLPHIVPNEFKFQRVPLHEFVQE